MDSSSSVFYTAGDGGLIVMRVFMSIFFIPFFNIPYALLVLPWIFGVPMMAAGMYPMAVIFFLITTCFFICPVFKQNWLSMEELKEKLQQVRAKGPSPTNRPNQGGPLSIDPVSFKQFEALVENNKLAGENWFIVRILSHDIEATWIGSGKHR